LLLHEYAVPVVTCENTQLFLQMKVCLVRNERLFMTFFDMVRVYL
jgi:hypothetical protein